ncbi:MAG: hypothetical protein AAF432_05540 [Planctomycetota bacterium]
MMQQHLLTMTSSDRHDVDRFPVDLIHDDQELASIKEDCNG